MNTMCSLCCDTNVTIINYMCQPCADMGMFGWDYS